VEWRKPHESLLEHNDNMHMIHTSISPKITSAY
jgi:hypothetical protein